MEVIKSRQNKLIVNTMRIRNDSNGSFLFLENIKLIQDALLSGAEILYAVILDKKLDYYLKKYPFLKNVKYYVANLSVIEYLSDTKTPQGLMAVVGLKEKTFDTNANFLVLDNIQDPGNVGTIIRSASGTSFCNIILINSANPYSQKVVRSSMGGIFKTSIKIFKTAEQFLEYKDKYNLSYIVADMGGENLFGESRLKRPIGVAVGNEGKGVSNQIKEQALKSVCIPMKNNLESLNVGVSCSIIIYYLDNLG